MSKPVGVFLSTLCVTFDTASGAASDICNERPIWFRRGENLWFMSFKQHYSDNLISTYALVLPPHKSVVEYFVIKIAVKFPASWICLGYIRSDFRLVGGSVRVTYQIVQCNFNHEIIWDDNKVIRDEVNKLIGQIHRIVPTIRNLGT